MREVQSPTFQFPDFLALLSATLILIAVLFLPWARVGTVTDSALNLMSATECNLPISLADSAANILLVPMAAISALAFALWGVFTPSSRRYSVPAISVATIAAYFYFLIYLKDGFSNLGLVAISSTGLGFWLAFLGTTGLLIHFVIPRRVVKEAELSPVTVDKSSSGGIPRRRPIQRPIGLEGFLARWGTLIMTAINFTIFFILWELLAKSGCVSGLLLPPCSKVIANMIELAQKGQLAFHLSFSAINFFWGFLIASVTGIPLGLALGASKTLDRIFGPYVWAFFSTPRLALLPLITLAMGFGSESKIFLVFIGAFFVIVINTWAGVRTVDESLIRAGRVFGANRFQIFTKIVVPYTLPFIIVGLRLGVTRALVVDLVSEMLASSRGMGYLVVRAVDSFKTEQVFSMILILVVVSMIMVTFLRQLEIWIAPWREGGSV